MKDGKILLYNNLDANSEVDFLYFIMFAVSKLNFDLKNVQFLVYGEIDENETFLGELQKFAHEVKIVEKVLKQTQLYPSIRMYRIISGKWKGKKLPLLRTLKFAQQQISQKKHYSVLSNIVSILNIYLY